MGCRHFTCGIADVLLAALQTFYLQRCRRFTSGVADVLLAALQTCYLQRFRRVTCSVADVLTCNTKVGEGGATRDSLRRVPPGEIVSRDSAAFL